MTTSDGGDNGTGENNRRKKVGYKSPPLHGQIKPGEVRNPHGRNGRSGPKADDGDLFGKVASRLTRVIIDGEAMMVPSEESFWLKQMHLAQQGDKAAARNIAREFGARRRLGPPPPTADELAKQEAEQAERERLSGNIVDAIERMTALKRRTGPPPVRYNHEGRPMVNKPADDGASAGSNEGIE